MTSLILLTAAGTGLGLWLIVIGLFPRPVRLDKALAALNRSPEPAPPTWTDHEVGWTARLGRPAIAVLLHTGLPFASTRRALAAVGMPVDAHVAEQATAAVIGAVLPVILTALLALGGTAPGVVLPVGAAVVLAVAGFFVPELAVRSEAAKHRAAFREAFGSFLDLVVVSLAGGAGVDQALDDAASVGTGPAYTELRHALAEARLARVPPWDTLAALGQRVGVPELHQLAATVGLAGTEGAKVRASLRSRAQALRTRQLTDAEGEASAATERMSLPIIGLFAGFLIFLGFPAVAAVLSGL